MTVNMYGMTALYGLKHIVEGFETGHLVELQKVLSSFFMQDKALLPGKTVDDPLNLYVLMPEDQIGFVKQHDRYLQGISEIDKSFVVLDYTMVQSDGKYSHSIPYSKDGTVLSDILSDSHSEPRHLGSIGNLHERLLAFGSVDHRHIITTGDDANKGLKINTFAALPSVVPTGKVCRFR